MARMMFPSPLGTIVIEEAAGAMIHLTWRGRAVAAEAADGDAPVLHEARRQVEAYFAGALKTFDLPLAPAVSPFERLVLDAMLRIPFGETRRYGDLARELNTQPQAIGQACGANPIPIIIPCHRILAANGLGGFSGAGGVETKVALLRHEGAAGLLI